LTVADHTFSSYLYIVASSLAGSRKRTNAVDLSAENQKAPTLVEASIV
jgi:hypothetical protein